MTQGLTEMAVDMVRQEIERPGEQERLPPQIEDCVRYTINLMGWDGMGWDGMGWDGMGCKRDGIG